MNFLRIEERKFKTCHDTSDKYRIANQRHEQEKELLPDQNKTCQEQLKNGGRVPLRIRRKLS